MPTPDSPECSCRLCPVHPELSALTLSAKAQPLSCFLRSLSGPNSTRKMTKLGGCSAWSKACKHNELMFGYMYGPQGLLLRASETLRSETFMFMRSLLPIHGMLCSCRDPSLGLHNCSQNFQSFYPLPTWNPFGTQQGPSKIPPDLQLWPLMQLQQSLCQLHLHIGEDLTGLR